MEEALIWASAFLLLAVFFLVFFRKNVGALIDRMNSIGIGALSASGSQPQSQATNDVDAAGKNIPKAVLDLLELVGQSPQIRQIEGQIHRDLEKNGLDARDPNTATVLIRHLAGAQLLAGFEQTYNTIFGSQIFLLRQLNEAAAAGKPRAHLEQHCQQARAAFPALKEWSLDQYVAYLLNANLMTVQNDTYRITPLGTEFLTWLARSQRSSDTKGL